MERLRRKNLITSALSVTAMSPAKWGRDGSIIVGCVGSDSRWRMVLYQKDSSTNGRSVMDRSPAKWERGRSIIAKCAGITSTWRMAASWSQENSYTNALSVLSMCPAKWRQGKCSVVGSVAKRSMYKGRLRECRNPTIPTPMPLVQNYCLVCTEIRTNQSKAQDQRGVGVCAAQLECKASPCDERIVGGFWTRPWRLRPWKPCLADRSTQLSCRTRGLSGTFKGFGAFWRYQAAVSKPYRTSWGLGLRPWGRPWEGPGGWDPESLVWQTGVHNFPGGLEGSPELLGVLGPFEGAKRQFRNHTELFGALGWDREGDPGSLVWQTGVHNFIGWRALRNF